MGDRKTEGKKKQNQTDNTFFDKYPWNSHRKYVRVHTHTHPPYSTIENITKLQKVQIIQMVFLNYNAITLETTKPANKNALSIELKKKYQNCRFIKKIPVKATQIISFKIRLNQQ